MAILAAFVVFIGVVLGVGPKTTDESLGAGTGEVHFTQDDFKAGIAVNGTEFLSSSRGITASTLIATGVTRLGSATAGLDFFSDMDARTATSTIAVAETGSIYVLTGAAQTHTLPAVASSAGTHYRFVVGGSLTGDAVISSPEGDNIEGTLLVAGAVVDCNANDIITFVSDGENIGDFVDVYSDGTYWYVGSSGGLTAAKMTCSG